MSSTTKPFEEKMNASVNHLIHELASIRAGRANPAILDKVTVDYYGSPTPIQQIAAVAVAEARILTISPWDRSMLKPISKAIQTSDIGINPIDDGQVIRLVFPAPTEERRKQLTKDVKKQGEDAEDCRAQHPPRRHGQVQGHEEGRRAHRGRPEEAGGRDPEADRQICQADRRHLRRQEQGNHGGLISP